MNDLMEQIWKWASDPNVVRIGTIALGIIAVWMLRIFVNRALNRSIKDTSNKYKARKAANLFAYVLILSVVLFVYSDKLGNFGVALGVAGAGIAFALQEVIISLAGWLSIVLTGGVSVGQRVRIGDVKGDIIDIGILSTTVMEMGDWVNGDLYNGRIVSLSNSFVFKENIHNYSAEYPFLWDEVTIPVRADSDVEQARTIFTQVLEEVCGDYARQSQQQWSKMTNKFRVEEARVNPMVTLAFDENWITFTLRYVVDFKRRRITKDLIFTRALEEISKTENTVQVASSGMEVSISQANDR